jgi:hypothetical protein
MVIVCYQVPIPLFYEISDLGPGFSCTRKSTSDSSVKSSVVAEAEEPKLNCLLEPNCGSGSFLFITDLKKLTEKNHGR